MDKTFEYSNITKDESIIQRIKMLLEGNIVYLQKLIKQYTQEEKKAYFLNTRNNYINKNELLSKQLKLNKNILKILENKEVNI
jgi:hypothetical protein